MDISKPRQPCLRPRRPKNRAKRSRGGVWRWPLVGVEVKRVRMYFGQHQQQYAQRGPPADNAALRRKEEQRRRQQEYAQALAQQVAQREQQKQRERELDRQAAGVTNGAAYQQRGNFNGNAAPPPPSTANADQQRGFFDGLGQNEQKSRTSFARGQRQPEQPS